MPLRAVEMTEESDFSLDVGNIVVFCVEVDDLESNDFARRPLPGLVHSAVRALADALELFVELGDGLLARSHGRLSESD